MSRRGAVVAGSGQIGLTASMRALKFAGRPKSLARCDARRGIAVRVRHRTSVVRRRLICTSRARLSGASGGRDRKT